MNKTEHLFENGIYLVSNHAVARNPMFDSKEMQSHFLKGMEKHLKPVCSILAYSLNNDQFQLLVKLSDRESISEHFLSKKRNQNLRLSEVPDSTYIFSQAMANLQVSFVKYYNYVNGRSGTLMAARFGRKLVETEGECLELVEKLNRGYKEFRYAKKWAVDALASDSPITSGCFYEDISEQKTQISPLISNIYNINLVGYFEKLPPFRLESKKRFFTMRFNQLFGQNPGSFF